MRWLTCALLLLGCAGQSTKEPAAGPVTPSSESTPVAATSSDTPAPLAPASHLCPGAAEPAPCKNDVMRQGGFQEVPACLRVLPPIATGSADGEAFARALSERTNEVFACMTGTGADPSQLGKVMTVRVVSEMGQPSQASFVSSDLSPSAKSCVEKAVRATKWPEPITGSSEVTLRLVLVTRVWVDDPKGACPPR